MSPLIRIRARVVHTQHTTAIVLQIIVNLILEWLTPNRHAALARIGRITTLDHEAGYVAMELGSLVIIN